MTGMHDSISQFMFHDIDPAILRIRAIFFCFEESIVDNIFLLFELFQGLKMICQKDKKIKNE